MSVRPAPVVIKLGGSLHDAPAAQLSAWLRVLATAPGPARVIVPGGGPFADAVRRLQWSLGFGELAAHRMAILAMQQLGLMLQEQEQLLTLVETEPEIAAIALASGAVWLPWRMVGLEPGIAASWDVTSDSLAIWLARRIGAARLLLVKSAPELPTGAADPAALAAADLVDAAFPGLAAGFTGEIHVAGRADAALVKPWLALS